MVGGLVIPAPVTARLARKARQATAQGTSPTARTMAEQDSTRRLTLREWTRCQAELTSEQAEALRSAGRGGQRWLRVEKIADRSGDTGIDDCGIYQLTPRHFVGSFAVVGLSVIVRPKIKLENLFLLLEVGLPPAAWREEASDYANSADLLPSLVSFFARTAETTVARGLFHHYRREEDDLLALRGRIDFARQFRRGGLLVPTACVWDDFTADVDENRCLLAGVRRSLMVPGVPAEDRRRLRRVAAALDGVAEIAPAAALDRIDLLEAGGFTRLNEHYRPALRLARLLLANLTLRDMHGDSAASAFMVDMNQLFEDFVTARLQVALRGRLDVDAQRHLHLDEEGRITIRPDLLLRQQGTDVDAGVADIKYKLAADASDEDGAEAAGYHGDYYQLLAYATALDVRDGTLIYCADANDELVADPAERAGAVLLPSVVTVRNAGTRLHTCAIDLSGSPSHIDAQITALSDHLEKSAARSTAR
ncbi:MAG: hypothetical protein F4190_00360 [Acidimicrobiales bacterium]|nr:hypothetical protein [Acidimicrobiales bacterium]